MPLDRAQFDSGVDDPIQYDVLKFLEEHPTKAFTLGEIVDSVRGTARIGIHGIARDTARVALVRAALEHWVSQGVVLSKAIDGETYYAVKAE